MNYSTHDLELATIIHALKMWRHYLMGRKFELRIDHCGLKHLFEQPTINAKKTRWIEFISEYDFEIKHIKGKENQVADGINMRAREMHIEIIIMFNNDHKDKIIEETNLDQHYLKIKETLQQGNLQHKFKYFEMKEDGVLIYRDKVYVPNSKELKSTMLGEMHNMSYYGHPGYHKSITVVRSQYFWP